MGVRVPPSAPIKLRRRNVLQDALRRTFGELAFPLPHIQQTEKRQAVSLFRGLIEGERLRTVASVMGANGSG